MPCLASTYSPYLRQLFLTVYAAPPATPAQAHTARSCTALIDTGATGSCVSGRLVSDLRLIASGKTPTHGVAGLVHLPFYFIDLIIPFGDHHFTIPALQVSEFSAHDHFDVLLGMDVLAQGHLSVDAFAGRFTFCV